MNWPVLLAVAAGGAAGSVARYVMMERVGHWLGTGFPFSTLAVNVAGSFAMGVFIELSALAWSPSPEIRALVVVGVLGGFTTFSTFSLDVALLLERHQTAAAVAYMAGSVLMSVAALFFGLAAVRGFVR